MTKPFVIGVGTEAIFDGDVVRIDELHGTDVLVYNHRNRLHASVSLARLAARVRPIDPGLEVDVEQELRFDALGESERRIVGQRARRLRWVIYGADIPHNATATPAPGLQDRKAQLAREASVNVRTVDRWLKSFRAEGEAGLIDETVTRRRRNRIDPRWEQQAIAVMGSVADASTITKDYAIELIENQLGERYGAGEVPIPSVTTQYRRLRELDKGKNTFSGSAKMRRSIADGPTGTFGKLRATRPGEIVILDTTILDVFVMEPVTCIWHRPQLTIAQDLFTRSILGLRVTAYSTKAVDVAGVLYETCHPVQADESLPEECRWSYHGIPENIVFTEDTAYWNVPLCPPESIVIDHGKAFLSAHVIGICERLGITVMPAQPKKPTDKPTCERFFRTLRQGLLQRLPAYTGPDVYSRGKNPEDEAFLYMHELERIIREWIAGVYHKKTHKGLHVPSLHGVDMSPDRMYTMGIVSAGILRLPNRTEDLYNFLAVAWRDIHRYGVQIDKRIYDGPALDAYRNRLSDYGGRHPGKYPFRLDPTDCRFIYFQDPVDNGWRTLGWEYAHAVSVPFADEAYRHARKLARTHQPTTERAAMRKLLDRWDRGMVTDRRDRRLAVQHGAQYRALPGFPSAEQRGDVETPVSPAAGDKTTADDVDFDAVEVDDLDDLDVLADDEPSDPLEMDFQMIDDEDAVEVME